MIGSATESSFIRPIRPDIQVGEPGGIPKKYASPDVIQRQAAIRGIVGNSRGNSTPVSRNVSGQQFQFGNDE